MLRERWKKREEDDQKQRYRDNRCMTERPEGPWRKPLWFLRINTNLMNIKFNEIYNLHVFLLHYSFLGHFRCFKLKPLT